MITKQQKPTEEVSYKYAIGEDTQVQSVEELQATVNRLRAAQMIYIETWQQKVMVWESKRCIRRLNRAMSLGKTGRDYIRWSARDKYMLWLKFYRRYPYYRGYLVDVVKDFMKYMVTIGIIKSVHLSS